MWTSLLWVVLVPVVLAVIGTVFITRHRSKQDVAEPVPVERPAGVRPGSCDQLTEIWHVVVGGTDAVPFFAAYCACEWVGPARDEADPDACAKATADAYGHGGNVAPNVVRPVD